MFFNLRKTKQRLGWFNENEVDMVLKELGVSKEDVIEMESRMTGSDVGFDLLTIVMTKLIPALYLEDKSSIFAAELENENFEIKLLSNCLIFEGLDERSQDIIRTRWLDENRATLQDLAVKCNISTQNA